MTEAVTYFVGLPLAELRRRQDLCRQQTAIAFEQRNTRALEALQQMDNDLTEAVFRQTWPEGSANA